VFVSRKFEAIDLTKLYSLGSANGWNEILTDCYNRRDIGKLAKIRYQIQAGMDDLVKLKLNTDEMCVFFVRLNRSIENTAKKIIKIRHPLPEDNPLGHDNFSIASITAKRKRDDDLALFLKQSAY